MQMQFFGNDVIISYFETPCISRNNVPNCGEIFHQEIVPLAVESVALTVVTATDWYIFTVMTVMNGPAVVSTFAYWRLVAGTVHVVKPDWFTVVAASIADMSTGPVLHIVLHSE